MSKPTLSFDILIESQIKRLKLNWRNNLCELTDAQEIKSRNVEAKKCEKSYNECSTRQPTNYIATNRGGSWKVCFFCISSTFSLFFSKKKTMFRMSIKWCNIRDLHFQMSEKFHARSSDSRSRLGRGSLERNKYFWKTNDSLFMLIKERRSSRIHCRYVKVSIQLINLI